jgi:hypothetical protein
VEILSPAPLARLGYPCKILLKMGMRTPGLEPGQKAWKALIITARSHPQIDRLNIFPVFVIYDDSHKCNIIAIKMTIRKIKISITGSFAYSWIT